MSLLDDVLEVVGIDDILGGIATVGGLLTSNNAAKEAGSTSLEAAKIAADAAKFRPYGVTTGFGSSWFDPENQRAGYELDPGLAAYRDAMIMGAGTVADTINLDPTQASQSYYNQMQNLMAPQRAQDQAALQQNLFGSGRLGMRLAGEGAGAGAGGGMYQPDVLGYNKAQELANQQMAMESRQRAQNEIDAGIARSQGLFSYGTGVEQLGMTPLQLGAELGGRASSAGAQVGQNLMQGGMAAAQANLAAGMGMSNALSQYGLGLLQKNKV